MSRQAVLGVVAARPALNRVAEQVYVLHHPLVWSVRAAAVPDRRQYPVHQVHYAMVVVLAMGVGLFAPPFGVGYYTACHGRVDPWLPLRAMAPYILALLVGLIIVAAIPAISIAFV